jgi:hypothetical protein
MNISTIEKELDAIRIKRYEQTKDMSPDERIVFIRESIAPVIKQYGLRTAPRVMPNDPEKAAYVRA